MRKIAVSLCVLGVAIALLLRNYAYVPSLDGGFIPIPYANPSLVSHMAEKEAPFKEMTQNRGGSRLPASLVARIPEDFWVDVVNLQGVQQTFSNGSKMLSKGDKCLAEFGGVIEVLHTNGESLLVVYTPPGEPFGTPCPKGTQFVTTKAEFRLMTSNYEAIRDAKLAQKDLVKRLLAQNIHGEVRDIDTWRWVDVMNIDPLIQDFSNGSDYISYGDTCGIGSLVLGDGLTLTGGSIEFRGSENGRMLYEYHPYKKPLGTSCPSGILFFDS